MNRYLFPSILCGLLLVLVGQSRGWAQSTNSALVVNRPFPQHITYAAGTLRPTNFTQAQQDDHVRTFYDYWKQNYLVAAGTNSAGKAMYRVAFGAGSSVTVSEGQGFGMVIVALMAGHDANAQTLFDGLWYFSRAYPSGKDNRLMTWKVDNGVAVGGNNNAFDGDVDIAYGLLLAHAQWGSGAVNYQSAATTVLDGVLASTIGPASRLPMLGDWVNANGSPHNQYTPRSSDFMPAHFRAFGRATNNSVWNTVITNSQAVINTLQTNHSATTGLLPDFIINCNPVTACTPANSGFLEGPHDGHYYYNAGRDPWRIGLDALLNNDAGAKATVQKMANWLADTTSNNASNIKAGYQLNGTAIGNYFTSFFVAPFGVAAMTAPTQQQFLNNIYASIYNRRESYYEDSVNLLSLLVMTGNYWDPTQSTTPTPTNTPGPSPTPTGTPLPTNTPMATTTPSPGQCTVGYTISNTWGTGFQADLTITNNSSTAINGWTLTWSFAGNQQITDLWNANRQQNGAQVTVSNLSWNGSIPAGSNLTGIGFTANYSGANPIPTNFALNGVACNGNATATPTPTHTPTATPPTATPIVSGTPTSDLIFADGFESGNLSAWTSSVTDGGDLSVQASAALTGSFGLQALLDDNVALYVTDDRPASERSYQARFRFHPHGLTMANGDSHFIFYGYTGASIPVLRLELRFAAGAYQLRSGLRTDGNTWITSSAWFPISNAPHQLELNWWAATANGANDGALTLLIDGGQKANLLGVDNDTRRIDRVRLGAIAGIDAGSRGSYSFDAFTARRLPGRSGATSGVASEAEEVAAEEGESEQGVFLPLVVR